MPITCEDCSVPLFLLIYWFYMNTLFWVVAICVVFSSLFFMAERRMNLTEGGLDIFETVDTGVSSNTVGDVSDALIEELVDGMSLDEKIGQMLIVGAVFKHDGIKKDDVEYVMDMIEQYHIGGVVLLGRLSDSVSVREQLCYFRRMRDRNGVPLFVAADQEGIFHRVSFLHERTLQSDIKDESHAYEVAFERAQELRSAGVTMNLAPVAEYVSDSNGNLWRRTFQTDPETTGLLSAAQVSGYFQGGVIPVLKHFPGYGDTIEDPDYSLLVEAPWSSDELDTHLQPFRKVIERYPYVPVMTAHVVVPLVDDKWVTRSSVFLSEILRKEMGHEGVIMTDAIQIGTAGKTGESVEFRAIDAIVAGADIVLFSGFPSSVPVMFSGIKQSVGREIAADSIDESVRRILALKLRMRKHEGGSEVSDPCL